MLFNSIEFLVFFPIVVILYFVIPRKVKHLWLLAASYYFYMCWNARYVLLILASTVITYVSGLLIERMQKTAWRKWVVAGSFGMNLGILFYFKYTNFALGVLTSLFARIHIELNAPVFDIVLPVGISFYTFQALSYTMDVYRGEIYAEKDFFRYALFVSFFPQLVAGPIERSKNLLKQLAAPAEFCFENAREGLLLMLWGFFLKIVMADRIAAFVDIVYGDFAAYPGMYLVVATMLFAVQLYCDFAGYSTIAMGAAKVMGITLMENFDAPYLSVSVAQFWRRWHISLTSWFRDYLYIPLGGSRKGKIRKYVNTMIVFLASGLWHGASVSFVVWGGLNGLYQAVGDALRPVRDRMVSFLHLNRESLGHKLIQVIGTFALIDFSFIFFRAGQFKDALVIIKSIVSVKNPWILFDGSLYNCGLDEKNFRLMLLGIVILLIADLCKRKGIKVREVIIGQDYWFRWIFITLAISGILTFGIWGPNYNEANFIYFQF